MSFSNTAETAVLNQIFVGTALPWNANSIQSRVLSTKFAGGVIANNIRTTRPAGTERNRFYGGVGKLSGAPNGYVHPGSWIMPQVAATAVMGLALAGSSTLTITTTLRSL